MISLVTATLGRTAEVRQLFESLAAQSTPDFEVVLVDQNTDDRLLPIVQEFVSRFPLRHVHSPVRGLSHARNLGLHCAAGEIVGFPDDDCVYPVNVLERVRAHFAQNPALALVSGPAVAPGGGLGSGRWTGQSGPITLTNVWTSVISFTFFARRSVLETVGSFDEHLGLGARFGSGEETDIAIRVLRHGYAGYYDLDLNVTHPDKRLTAQAARRAFSYGMGMGRVLRKHSFPASNTLLYLLRPIGGVLLSLIRARPVHASYYWHTFRGRVSGFLARPAAAG